MGVYLLEDDVDSFCDEHKFLILNGVVATDDIVLFHVRLFRKSPVSACPPIHNVSLRLMEPAKAGFIAGKKFAN